MNGITRVLVSVALLGACAVAMRFTMYTVDVPEAKPQHFTARLDVSKAKKLKMHIEATRAKTFYIKAGVAGRVAGTYGASANSQLLIRDSTKYSEPKLPDTTSVSYIAGLNKYSGFLLGQPETYDQAELRLPRGVPISMDVYQHYWQSPPSIDLDLSDLEIEDVTMPDIYDKPFESIAIRMPQGNYTTYISIRPRAKHNIIWFSQKSFGRMQLRVDQMAEFMWLNSTIARDNMKVWIYGQATNPQEFVRRVDAYPNMFLEQPTQGVENTWILRGEGKNASPDSFRLEIDLGKTGRVKL